MEYGTFFNYMKKIVDIIELQDEIDGVLRKYNNTVQTCPSTIYMPTLIDEVISLLELVLNDKAQWISYWIYELDCGRRWEKGCVLNSKGDEIPLESINDLWKCIIEDE